MNNIITPPKQKEANCDKCVHCKDCTMKLKHLLPILDWILGVQKFVITITMCKRFMFDPNTLNPLEVIDPKKGKSN